MRLAYFSDLHLEFHVQGRTRPLLALGPDLAPLRGNIDALLIAGDIGTMEQYLEYGDEAEDFLGVPVITIPGNHEYYGMDCPQTFDDRMDLNIGEGVRVLCCTLWTDFNALGTRLDVMRQAPRLLNDFRLIHGMTPQIMLHEHLRSKVWLLERLAEPHAGRTVIMTHNSPSPVARNMNYTLDAIGCCFTSGDCGSLLDAARDAGVTEWIYGHDHYTQNVEVAGLTLRSAQLGYPGEATGWNGIGLVEI